MNLQKILQSKVIALDTETTGLNWREDRIHCVSLSDGRYSECVHFDEENRGWLALLLKNSNILKVFANVNFDIHFFQRMGIEEYANCMDIQYMTKILNENLPSYRLKDLAAMYIDKDAHAAQDKVAEWVLAHGGVKAGHKIKGWDSSKIPDEVLFPYAKKDALYTYKLYELFMPAIEKDYKRVYELEKSLIPVIIAMERRGVPIDTEFLAKQGKAFSKLLAPIRRALKKVLGNINYGSNQQIARVLDLKGIRYPLTEKGNPALNKESIQEITHPIGEKLLEYRQAVHLRSTYCEGVRDIAVDSTLYPAFQQMGARTGRMSCREPNIQNIPQSYGLIRKGFGCRKGFLNFYFDYSQIEMCILAEYSQDENLLRAIQLRQDLHTATAARFFGVSYTSVTEKQRKTGKTLNFAISYGMGARGLARKFKVSEEDARETLNKYYSLYPSVKFLNDRAQAKVRERGYVMTVTGRRRRLPKGLAYIAINAVVQGSAADIIKSAMIKVNKVLAGTRSGIISQIHDELIVELHKEELYLAPVIKFAMEDTKAFFDVPLRVDVEYTRTAWADKKKWKYAK